MPYIVNNGELGAYGCNVGMVRFKMMQLVHCVCT